MNWRRGGGVPNHWRPGGTFILCRRGSEKEEEVQNNCAFLRQAFLDRGLWEGDESSHKAAKKD